MSKEIDEIDLMEKLNLDKFIGEPDNSFTRQAMQNEISDFILRNSLKSASVDKIPLKYFPQSFHESVRENLPEDKKNLEIDLEESYLQFNMDTDKCLFDLFVIFKS